MSETKKRLELRSVFDLGLPSVGSREALCDSEAGIYLTASEEYPAPDPYVVLESSSSKINRFLDPTHPYKTPGFFFAKLSGPLYFTYCNLTATDDGDIIREGYPNRNAPFDAWPFTYLPGRERRKDGYYYDREPAFYLPHDVLIGAHSSAGVFGHFLLDTVSTALLFRNQLIEERLKLALFEPSPWMLDLLSAAGIPAGSILVIPQRIVRFRSAIVTSALSATSTYSPGSIVTGMYETLRKAMPRPLSIPPLRIFLLRGEKAKRIANEIEVAAVFADAGFLAAKPHHLSIECQMILASSADIIAGSFGSGHALSGLMAAGSVAIEFLPPDKEDAWFLRLAARRHLDHRIVVTGEDGKVNIEWLKSRLESLFTRSG